MSKKHLWYKCSTEGVQDQHDVDVDEAVKIINTYISEFKDSYDNDEDAISATVFGFAKTNSIFIEFSIDTRQEFRIKYEGKEPYKLLFLNLSKFYQKEYKLDCKTTLENVTKKYFEETDEDFRTFFDQIKAEEVKARGFVS